MSLFSNVMGKIFGSSEEAKKKVDAAADTAAEATGNVAESVSEAVEAGGEKVAEAVESIGEDLAEAASSDSGPEAASKLDVEAMLDEMAEKHPEDLEWRLTIVDLLKLLDLDSSYEARKGMALELGYSQDDIDGKGSAEMNIWLHRQVMNKITENGGKVPADLLD